MDWRRLEKYIINYDALFCVTGEHVSSGCKEDPLQQLSYILLNAENFHVIPKRLIELMEALRKFCSRSLENCQDLLRTLQAACLPLLCMRQEMFSPSEVSSEKGLGGMHTGQHAISSLQLFAMIFFIFHGDIKFFWMLALGFTHKTKQTLPVGFQRATSLKP